MKTEYNHMESTDKYGTPVMEDKSVKYCEDIGNKLFELFAIGNLSREELAHLTGIPVWKIDRILAGDEDFSIYEITHIANVLGYDFQVAFNKL